jgi:hypothetical protein
VYFSRRSFLECPGSVGELVEPAIAIDPVQRKVKKQKE